MGSGRLRSSISYTQDAKQKMQKLVQGSITLAQKNTTGQTQDDGRTIGIEVNDRHGPGCPEKTKLGSNRVRTRGQSR